MSLALTLTLQWHGVYALVCFCRDDIQSRRCYEAAVRHGVSVMVMEPVKGGTLANPPEEARKMLAELDPEITPYAMALRFAESLPGVEIVLSGMSAGWQVEENMRERFPLSEKEQAGVLQAAKVINRAIAIPCSGCGYCLKGCPKSICIPNYFRLYNDIFRNPNDGWKIEPAYQGLVHSFGKASECIGCGQCESHCPQKLPIRNHLKLVSAAFD